MVRGGGVNRARPMPMSASHPRVSAKSSVVELASLASFRGTRSLYLPSVWEFDSKLSHIQWAARSSNIT